MVTASFILGSRHWHVILPNHIRLQGCNHLLRMGCSEIEYNLEFYSSFINFKDIDPIEELRRYGENHDYDGDIVDLIGLCISKCNRNYCIYSYLHWWPCCHSYCTAYETRAKFKGVDLFVQNWMSS